MPYLLEHFKTSVSLFCSLGSLWTGLWDCEHAALPCDSECFVQVVLGQLSYPCPISLIYFPLAGCLVNIYSIRLSSFHFISRHRCTIYLTPLLCYLKQEQNTDCCKIWGAVLLFALVLQHPCDAFTVLGEGNQKMWVQQCALYNRKCPNENWKKVLR